MRYSNRNNIRKCNCFNDFKKCKLHRYKSGWEKNKDFYKKDWKKIILW